MRLARASCSLVVDLALFLFLCMSLTVEVEYYTQAYFLLHLGMPGRDDVEESSSSSGYSPSDYLDPSEGFQEEAKIAVHERRTRGASSSEQPLTNKQLDTIQVASDNVGSVRPDDDTAP